MSKWSPLPGPSLTFSQSAEGLVRLHSQLPTVASGVQGGRSHGRQHGPTHCTSCDTQLDNFEMANARQLNGRCSSCHELFRKGNYCPVCEKVRIVLKGRPVRAYDMVSS